MKKFLYKILGVYLNTLAYIAPGPAAKQGFRLFCFPVKIPLKPNHKKFLDKGVDTTFQHGSDTIQVYKWGNGTKKILFLHGWQSHSFRWKNYIEALSGEDFTMYSLDAPAHGYSTGNMLHVPLYSDVIESFIKSAGTMDAVVCHSMGGFAMVYSLYRSPSLPVKQLVIMGAPGEAMDFVSVYKNLLSLSNKMIGLTLDYFKSHFGKPMDFFSVSRFASGLSQPGLIVHEKLDKEAPYEHALKLLQKD
jgi:pimeloyl-ACP methyl ester carboxylesterase